jgi:hypothetical protein
MIMVAVGAYVNSHAMEPHSCLDYVRSKGWGVHKEKSTSVLASINPKDFLHMSSTLSVDHQIPLSALLSQTQCNKQLTCHISFDR